MQRPGQVIRLRSSARTNTGRVRDNNEDSIHLWEQDEHLVLAIVADGMGGAVAGEEASRIAVETIQLGLLGQPDNSNAHYLRMNDYDLSSLIKEAIRSANSDIVDQANDQPELKGMGTTVTLALVRDTQVIVGHVGDSRAYIVSGHNGHIAQVTSDHSFVQALVAAGHITEEEADLHPMKNVLYRALGQAREVDIDIYYEQMVCGDWLVLCSDGLTLHVNAREIAGLVTHYDDPAEVSQRLVDLANERGGRDNVSVIVIKVEGEAGSDCQPDILTDDDEDTLVGEESPGFGSSEAAGPGSQQEGRSEHITNPEPPGVFSPPEPNNRHGPGQPDDHQ